MKLFEYSEDGSSWEVTRNSERWTQEEIELAMDDTISDEELAEVLERTIIAVRGRRKLLRTFGLYKSDISPRSYHKYTEEDDEFIATHTPVESSEFLGVSVGSINYRRSKLAKDGKLELRTKRKFSEDEIEVLKDTSLSNAECARKLNRSESSISYKRDTLKKQGLIENILRARRRIRYTNEEIEILENPDISNYECSRILDRTMSAIRSKRSHLEIDTKVIRSPRSDRRGLYYDNEIGRSPYPTQEELQSWGIKVDRDWDDLPFNQESGLAW